MTLTSPTRSDHREDLRPNRSVLRQVHALTSEKGRIAAIEPRSGEYFVADSFVAAARLARRRFPRGVFYFVRIGATVAHVQCGGFRRVRACESTARGRMGRWGLVRCAPRSGNEPLAETRALVSAGCPTCIGLEYVLMSAQSVALCDLELARKFARGLARYCDPQGFEVVLFGSRARGDADAESDLDLFVTLKQDDPDGRVKAAARQLACDLTLESGTLVSVFVADRTFLRRHQGYSFVEAVEREGVRV